MIIRIEIAEEDSDIVIKAYANRLGFYLDPESALSEADQMLEFFNLKLALQIKQFSEAYRIQQATAAQQAAFDAAKAAAIADGMVDVEVTNE